MGSSGGNASRDAQRAEEQRRREVMATQQAIERIYGSPAREAQIGDVVGATRQYLQKDLDRQNAKSARNLKFALARSGTSYGSVDVDQNKALSEAYLRGALETERRAQQAGTSLRQADQSSKLNLFNMATAGLDMTTAVRNAGESMRSNIAGAQSDAMQSGLGDVFAQFGDIYKSSRERAGRRDQDRQLGAYNPSPYGPYIGGYAYPNG